MATATAPMTTAAMLAEIESGTAAQMLMAVGYNTAPPGPTFIPELDDAILQLRPHAGRSAFQRGDLVELVGASGSGKTTLLVFLLCTFLLPAKVEFPTALLPAITTSQHPPEIECGGREASCIILQPTTHASVLPRVAAALTGHVNACMLASLKAVTWWTNHPVQIKLLEDEVQKIVRQSLDRLEVVRLRPRWNSWALGLRRIVEVPPVCTDDDKPQTVGLVVCDGFGDAYYPEKWAEEQYRFEKASGNTPAVSAAALKGLRTMDDVGLPEVLAAVTAIRQHLGSVVILGVQGLWRHNPTPYYSSHLPPPYPHPFSSRPRENANTNDKWPLNMQITLQPPLRPLQFPPESLAGDALRSAMLANLNEYGEFIGHPRTRITGHVRVNGPRNLASESGEGGKFSFGIGPEGLEAWH